MAWFLQQHIAPAWFLQQHIAPVAVCSAARVIPIIPVIAQRFPAQGSEGPSPWEDGKCGDAASTCTEVSTQTGSPARTRFISSDSEEGSPDSTGSVCAEPGNPALVEYDTDDEGEQGMCMQAYRQREKHWQGGLDDARWRFKMVARMRITFGMVTRHPDYNHVAVLQTAICTVCSKEASGPWHAKECLTCKLKRPQFQGTQGGSAVVKCGTCGELAVGCKTPLQSCKCNKTALELSLETLCPHVKAVVSVGCTHNRVGNCNRDRCNFCHCAAPLPLRQGKKQSRRKARSGGGQETWMISWSVHWRNYVKVQMVGRRIEDYVVFNNSNDVVDPLTQPQDENSFPLRFVLKAKIGKAQQQPPTEWLASVGAVFQCKSWR